MTVSVEQPRVTVGGSTSAHVGGNFAITSGGVKVVASAPDNVATGNAISIVAAGVTVAVADQAATTDDTTQAYVPANSGLTISGGSLSLQATSSDTAVAGQVAIGVAGVNINVAKSEANAGGSNERLRPGGGVDHRHRPELIGPVHQHGRGQPDRRRRRRGESGRRPPDRRDQPHHRGLHRPARDERPDVRVLGQDFRGGRGRHGHGHLDQ